MESVLSHACDAEVGMPPGVALIGQKFADDELREGGLPGAVGPDDADAAPETALHEESRGRWVTVARVGVNHILQPQKAFGLRFHTW
mmetsp:Transcript_3637/g.8247  ORF Transcript_3637/g.8247 Transcript_3637/m.8247 type:complete len:87 (+) Transcript_3637:489-749(+)